MIAKGNEIGLSAVDYLVHPGSVPPIADLVLDTGGYVVVVADYTEDLFPDISALWEDIFDLLRSVRQAVLIARFSECTSQVSNDLMTWQMMGGLAIPCPGDIGITLRKLEKMDSAFAKKIVIHQIPGLFGYDVPLDRPLWLTLFRLTRFHDGDTLQRNFFGLEGTEDFTVVEHPDGDFVELGVELNGKVSIKT